MITITHTHADGTLLTGSHKGDGVYEIVHALHGHWRSFRSLGCLGIVQSRDKAAKTWLINSAAEALRAADHEVTVEIDEGESRSFAEQEAERNERADARADYHAGQSAAATAHGERMWEQASAVYGALNGTPVLVGHHSERRLGLRSHRGKDAAEYPRVELPRLRGGPRPGRECGHGHTCRGALGARLRRWCETAPRVSAGRRPSVKQEPQPARTGAKSTTEERS